MTLHCSICLYVRTGVAPEAVTVINGQAVCYDHMGYVAGGGHSSALRIALNELKSAPAEPAAPEHDTESDGGN